ncbi:hypothetical protein RZS08_32460, partial [Arthrospira platensis SPKY1]|nr:hypothetical protein [Arthrospira platensis SPKY1]
ECDGLVDRGDDADRLLGVAPQPLQRGGELAVEVDRLAERGARLLRGTAQQLLHVGKIPRGARGELQAGGDLSVLVGDTDQLRRADADAGE